MSELLIDDAGTVWPAEPEIINRRFGLRRASGFLSQAMNLGFISVILWDTGARVAFRPQLVSRSAVSRLCGIFGQRDPVRVALSHDVRMSSWELIIGVNRTIARIAQLIAEARSPSPRPLLTNQRLPLERCLDVGGAQLFPILEAWQQRLGRWEPDLHGHLRERQLLPVTVISEQPRASERVWIRHWGANLTTFGKEWTRVAPGRDVEDQPNTDVGRWRATMLRQIAADDVPRYTKSDLVVRRMDGRLARLKFYRLDLPWRASDGALRITGTMVARRTLILDRANPAN